MKYLNLIKLIYEIKAKIRDNKVISSSDFDKINQGLSEINFSNALNNFNSKDDSIADEKAVLKASILLLIELSETSNINIQTPQAAGAEPVTQISLYEDVKAALNVEAKMDSVEFENQLDTTQDEMARKNSEHEAQKTDFMLGQQSKSSVLERKRGAPRAITPPLRVVGSIPAPVPGEVGQEDSIPAPTTLTVAPPSIKNDGVIVEEAVKKGAEPVSDVLSKYLNETDPSDTPDLRSILKEITGNHDLDRLNYNMDQLEEAIKQLSAMKEKTSSKIDDHKAIIKEIRNEVNALKKERNKTIERLLGIDSSETPVAIYNLLTKKDDGIAQIKQLRDERGHLREILKVVLVDFHKDTDDKFDVVKLQMNMLGDDAFNQLKDNKGNCSFEDVYNAFEAKKIANGSKDLKNDVDYLVSEKKTISEIDEANGTSSDVSEYVLNKGTFYQRITKLQVLETLRSQHQLNDRNEVESRISRAMSKRINDTFGDKAFIEIPIAYLDSYHKAIKPLDLDVEYKLDGTPERERKTPDHRSFYERAMWSVVKALYKIHPSYARSVFDEKSMETYANGVRPNELDSSSLSSILSRSESSDKNDANYAENVKRFLGVAAIAGVLGMFAMLITEVAAPSLVPASLTIPTIMGGPLVWVCVLAVVVVALIYAKYHKEINSGIARAVSSLLKVGLGIGLAIISTLRFAVHSAIMVGKEASNALTKLFIHARYMVMYSYIYASYAYDLHKASNKEELERINLKLDRVTTSQISLAGAVLADSKESKPLAQKALDDLAKEVKTTYAKLTEEMNEKLAEQHSAKTTSLILETKDIGKVYNEYKESFMMSINHLIKMITDFVNTMMGKTDESQSVILKEKMGSSAKSTVRSLQDIVFSQKTVFTQYKDRKTYVDSIDKREAEAAIKIQSLFRGNSCRKDIEKDKAYPRLDKDLVLGVTHINNDGTTIDRETCEKMYRQFKEEMSIKKS
ncbi:MAG: hypothetical protein VX835_02775 [Pseudomonadota bacterium]|nr:hypothetical protein [Pseudomonadota bacterium]